MKFDNKKISKYDVIEFDRLKYIILGDFYQMKKKDHSNQKLEAVTFKTLVVGVDIAKRNQWARFVDCCGIEHDKAIKFENNRMVSMPF